MRSKLHFQARTEVDDGFGNITSGPFQTVFLEPARLKPGLGSETVQAARLQGVQPYTITIRSSTRTRQITTAWRAVDARDANRVFDIKAIANPDEWDMDLSILAVQQ